MLIKIYWKCADIQKEIYTLKKTPTKIMGFTYPIEVKDYKYLPHWTYHSDRNRPPKIHHRSRSGNTLDFMTLEAPYLQTFQNFEGVVWSVPSLGAPFAMCHAINVSGYPEEPEQEIVFPIRDDQADWTHYLNVLLIERSNFLSLSEQAVNQLRSGYHVISTETIDEGNEPNILIVFSRNRVDNIE